MAPEAQEDYLSRDVSTRGEVEGIKVVMCKTAAFDDGNYARITINDVAVEFKEGEGDSRGLHIAVINPKDFKVAMAKVFDTYKSSDELDNFIKSNDIPKGYIVAAACKDDCTTNLSKRGISWFETLGSKEL